MRTRIRVNGKGGNFQKLTVKDIIETPAVSYDKNSFRITNGRWEIGADGYFALKNEVDVTNQIPINFNGNSFTIDFTNVRGEGYYIKCDMKLSYRPVNQEIVNNRISGYNDTQVLMDEVIRAVYQESGGEANGYHFTIKIHKENENGDSLSGAVFEVIRDSSGVKVGEITTDSNGNGSLGGLLKDKYTIKEKKAPEGYMLSTETVKVVPSDFGPDKSVTKTIKNSYAPGKPSITVTKHREDGNYKSNSPKTGDSSKPVQSALVLCASSVILAVVAAKKRRKNIQ